MFTKKFLQDVCEKFHGAEQHVKERIEALGSKSKLSIDEITYLFTTILRMLVKTFQASF